MEQLKLKPFQQMLINCFHSLPSEHREAYCMLGRRGGKSVLLSYLAKHTTQNDGNDVLIVGPTLEQARDVYVTTPAIKMGAHSRLENSLNSKSNKQKYKIKLLLMDEVSWWENDKAFLTCVEFAREQKAAIFAISSPRIHGYNSFEAYTLSKIVFHHKELLNVDERQKWGYFRFSFSIPWTMVANLNSYYNDILPPQGMNAESSIRDYDSFSLTEGDFIKFVPNPPLV